MSMMSIDPPCLTTALSTRTRGLKRKGEDTMHLELWRGDMTPAFPSFPTFPSTTFSTTHMFDSASSSFAQATNTHTDNTASTSISQHNTFPPNLKQQKLSHCVLQADDTKCTRVKFAPGIVLRTKKLYQEPWGVMVSSLEDYPPLQIKIGQRYWAKWDGMSCPFSCRPILQAIHSVGDASQVFER